MKIIWEPSDIRGGIHLISSNGSEEYLISCSGLQKGYKEYGIVSLKDGMVLVDGQTNEMLAQYLNEMGAKLGDSP